MYSQGILTSESTESTGKKNVRAIHILGFIELIFIFICFLLLLLNQYLNTIVDDYSPAYKIPDEDDDDDESGKAALTQFNFSPTVIPQETTGSFYQMNNSTIKIPSTMQSQEEETQKMFLPKTHSLPSYPTTDTITTHTTDITETVGNDTGEVFNNHSSTNDSNLETGEDELEGNKVKKSALNVLKTKTARKHLKSDETILETSPDDSKTATNLKSKQKQAWAELFVSNLTPVNASIKVKRDTNIIGKKTDMKTKLSHLLIMYPCCVSAIMILLMQMISRFTNDNMFKSTLMGLISTCIGLGITVFAVSVIESLNQRNSITILIAVGSAIFTILEIIDLILLFTRMENYR